MARRAVVSLLSLAIAQAVSAQPTARPDYYGTLEPFASNAIYFVMTDRFVNGDPGNDQRDQGGAHPTFDRPTPNGPAGQTDNVGYLGGDFKGIVDNADYIHDMGFGAVWVTPIVDNPDENFTGGTPATWGGFWTDGGKTGYHGYWGDNFYQLDEHWPSKALDFADMTATLSKHGLLTVLDIVCNHGSPSYTMPVDQPKYGKIYDKDGKLLADHQNLPPEKLDPTHNPLHRFYNTKGGLAQLSDLNENNPDVLDYLSGAYLQWIDQGAAAFRIDTLGWMPDTFWKAFAYRIRAKHPGFYMFGEAFDYDASKIAGHTWPENGGINVLDFPLKERLADAFGKKGGGFETFADRLFLTKGPYRNPYDLVTFYDNHDMARLDASDAGFIDAHNWLFTARGIPAIYYGSEVGFMRGTSEHSGNRNYFGQERIAAAAGNPIREHLKRIATLREHSPALQRGLQLDVLLEGDRAAFYRVFQHEGVNQIALVLLNKGATSAAFDIRKYLQAGKWKAALAGTTARVGRDGRLRTTVPAHDVEVYLLDAPVSQPELQVALAEAMKLKSSR